MVQWQRLTAPNSYDIVCSELTRLWQYYLGLPVHPRTWKFQRPNLDEL